MFYTRIMLDTSSSAGVDNTKNVQGEKKAKHIGCHEKKTKYIQLSL